GADPEGRASEANPWNAESDTDRERIFGREEVRPLPFWIACFLVGLLSVLDGWIAWTSDQCTLALSAAVCFTALGSAIFLPFLPTRRVIAWTVKAVPQIPGLDLRSPIPLREQIAGLGIGVCVSVLLVLLIVLGGIRLELFALVALGYGLFRLVQMLTA